MSKKIFVVTGANAGIGKEIALGLLQTGATILAVDRDDATSLKQTALSLQLPGTIDSIVADLSSKFSLQAAAAEIIERYPHIDALVNNAGRHLMARETSADGYEMNFALNCLGSFMLTWLLMEPLKASEAGRVVNLASEAHRVPGFFDINDLNTEHSPMSYAYGKSKFGIILWTRAMARHFQGTSVTVNAVCPGLVKTRIFENWVPAWLLPFTVLMTKTGLMSTPAQGARKPIDLVLSPEYSGVTGKFYGSHCLLKHVPANKGTNDQQLQQLLMDTLLDIVRR